MAAIGFGDSGGTITEGHGADDDSSAIVGLVSNGSAGTVNMALLWPGPDGGSASSNLDFVMGEITRGCALGSPNCHLDDSMATPLADADGDGIPDVADLCPELHLLFGTPNLRGTNHRDSDGDWRGDDCDQCPGVCDMAADISDMDGDGVFDQCDACVDRPPLPACPRLGCDPDRDGIPSACDLCPTVRHFPAGVNHADNDRDGIGDECDNCAGDANPSQANCNLDAEKLAGAYDPEPDPTDPFATQRFGIGDVCDDRECAQTWVHSQSSTVGGLRSRSLQGLAFDPLRAPADAEPARTGLRICRCEIERVEGTRPGGGGPLDPNFTLGDDLATRDTCAQLDVANCTISNTGIYDALQANAPGDMDDPEPISPWRRMTIDYGPGADLVAPDGDPSRRERRLHYHPPVGDGLFVEVASASWNRTADQTRWSTLRLMDPAGPDNPLFGVFPGVIWTHTPGFGLDASGNFSDFLRALTSHYWSGVIPRAQVADLNLLADLLRVAVPFLPLPEGVGISHTPDFGERMSPAFPASFLYAKPDGTAALGFADGAAISIPSLLPLGLEQAFGQGLDAGFWVAASESGRFLPDFGPRYAVLDRAGTQVLARLDSTAFGLSPPDLSPNQQPPGDPVPPPNEPPFPEPAPKAAQSFMAPTSSAPSTASHGPPPRETPLFVLSARRQQLWVLGGVRDGMPAQDIWRFDLPSGRISSLDYPERTAPQRVLAARYDASRDVLWVLDETSARAGYGHRPWRHGARVRLLRLDPNGQGASVEASWPRLVGHDLTLLAVDPGGALWLAASLGRGAHVVVRFEARAGRLRPVALDFAPRALASRQAQADERGLSFLVRQGRGVAVPAGASVTDLHALRASELLRCF